MTQMLHSGSKRASPFLHTEPPQVLRRLISSDLHHQRANRPLWVDLSRPAGFSGRPLSRPARSRSQKSGDLLESRRCRAQTHRQKSARNGLSILVSNADQSQGIHAPWNPAGMRRGSCTTASGGLLTSLASRTTTSEVWLACL